MFIVHYGHRLPAIEPRVDQPSGQEGALALVRRHQRRAQPGQRHRGPGAADRPGGKPELGTDFKSETIQDSRRTLKQKLLSG